MTRKDYELIALALRDAREGCVSDAQRIANSMAAQSIAQRLADENGRFDRERFLRACGVQS